MDDKLANVKKELEEEINGLGEDTAAAGGTYVIDEVMTNLLCIYFGFWPPNGPNQNWNRKLLVEPCRIGRAVLLCRKWTTLIEGKLCACGRVKSYLHCGRKQYKSFLEYVIMSQEYAHLLDWTACQSSYQFSRPSFKQAARRVETQKIWQQLPINKVTQAQRKILWVRCTSNAI